MIVIPRAPWKRSVTRPMVNVYARKDLGVQDVTGVSLVGLTTPPVPPVNVLMWALVLPSVIR